MHWFITVLESHLLKKEFVCTLFFFFYLQPSRWGHQFYLMENPHSLIRQAWYPAPGCFLSHAPGYVFCFSNGCLLRRNCCSYGGLMKIVCLYANLLGRDLIGSRPTLSWVAASRETSYLSVSAGILKKVVFSSLSPHNFRWHGPVAENKVEPNLFGRDINSKWPLNII